MLAAQTVENMIYVNTDSSDHHVSQLENVSFASFLSSLLDLVTSTKQVAHNRKHKRTRMGGVGSGSCWTIFHFRGQYGEHWPRTVHSHWVWAHSAMPTIQAFHSKIKFLLMRYRSRISSSHQNWEIENWTDTPWRSLSRETSLSQRRKRVLWTKKYWIK